MLRLVRSLVELTAGSRRRSAADGFLLSPGRFELAATAERMRVDRNHSVVSLLLIEPSATKSSPRDLQELERRMASRLRLTDTAGWLRDGRIGILLPDTPESGGWKVAADLCEAYQVGADRPACDVVVYPGDDRGDDEPDDNDPTDSATPENRIEVPEPVSVNGSTVRGPHLNGSSPKGAPLNGKPISGSAVAVALKPAPRLSATQQASCAAALRFDNLFLQPIPAWKRLIDIAGASFGLLCASPLIAIGAAAVKLTTHGPAFFVQEREGYGGHHFKMYKLRTMRPDAEQMKSGLRSRSEQDGPAFKLADDPRVTRIGRLLRKTSIDELPQLWNVLRGDMSLVGPRPLPVDESLACRPWQRRRLHVTPGLTCTWQIYGRNVVPFDEWIRMDLDYAERRSPWLDLKLVAQTGPSILLQKGR